MSGYAYDVDPGYKTIGTFIRNVTTAGTALQVSTTSVPCAHVVLNARLGNTNPVVVGDANVVAANVGQRGIVLVPGNNPVMIEIQNLNLLYVDSQTNGDGVCGAYFL